MLSISYRLQTQVPDLNSSLEMVTMLTSKKVLSCLVRSLVNSVNLRKLVWSKNVGKFNPLTLVLVVTGRDECWPLFYF